ncbi:mRNA capping enzyme family protein [Klebsormidium nitens]|uniref:mRNA guanylyltransferase n=1 Tax=Klebsormidium nitens TaxID=105231 RepID=A0A1Y1IEM4_KLENI|nr:mRNA capping enzyme family protein [Klebsormidium nitens]|eukprot:GAQ88422.1 mRNA capping enzyme family protein [Klebsormidium nitens]
MEPADGEKGPSVIEKARAARKAKLEERLALEAERKRKAEEQEAARPAKRQALDGGGNGVPQVEGGESNGAAESTEAAGHAAPQGFPARSLGPIPEGWLQCPPYGEPVDGLIPCKVPLGERFDHLLELHQRLTPKLLTERLRRAGTPIGLVIDLTNTNRYYKEKEFTSQNVKYIKIGLRGRNEVPDAESVNLFYYEVMRYRQTKGAKHILVHCTHGHNRTGYMIATFLARTTAPTVAEANQRFAAARPPGIYKEEYLAELFAVHHERRPPHAVTPSVPDWKRPLLDLNGDAPSDSEEEMDDDGKKGAWEPAPEPAPAPAAMTIDDVIGDPVPLDQQQELRAIVYSALGERPGRNGNLNFPGSQPVSLSNENMRLLRERYYYVTWKADGTRYMMLILREGAYLIDRNFSFRRAQVRFPAANFVFPEPPESPSAPRTALQHATLLDGEMVVDHVPPSAPGAPAKQERRFLVYDIMLLNGQALAQLPFSQRFPLILSEVIAPRKKDEALNRKYDYTVEPFRVRRKDFYELQATPKLLKQTVPKLSHEADGLIFQGWDDKYVTRTFEGLLKWKYAHMNSVDFLFKVEPDGKQHLYLTEGKERLRELEGATVHFADGEDPASFHDKIIECARGTEPGSWSYMRVRTDKSHPNAYAVYLKVLNSIRDNITEEKILQTIDEITRMPSYTSRQTPRPGGPPPTRPGAPGGSHRAPIGHVNRSVPNGPSGHVSRPVQNGPSGHGNRPVQNGPSGHPRMVQPAPFAGDTDSPSDRPPVPLVSGSVPSGGATAHNQEESKASSAHGDAHQSDPVNSLETTQKKGRESDISGAERVSEAALQPAHEDPDRNGDMRALEDNGRTGQED